MTAMDKDAHVLQLDKEHRIGSIIGLVIFILIGLSAAWVSGYSLCQVLFPARFPQTGHYESPALLLFYFVFDGLLSIVMLLVAVEGICSLPRKIVIDASGITTLGRIFPYLRNGSHIQPWSSVKSVSILRKKGLYLPIAVTFDNKRKFDLVGLEPQADLLEIISRYAPEDTVQYPQLPDNQGLYKGDKADVRAIWYMGALIPAAWALTLPWMYIPSLALLWLDKVPAVDPLIMTMGIVSSALSIAIAHQASKARGTTVRINGGRVDVEEWYGRKWSFDLEEPTTLNRDAYLFGRLKLPGVLGKETRTLKSGKNVVYVHFSGVDREGQAEELEQQLGARHSS